LNFTTPVEDDRPVLKAKHIMIKSFFLDIMQSFWVDGGIKGVPFCILSSHIWITGFWIFPLNIAVPKYVFILGISMLLYYKIFQAMHAKIRNGQEAMLGKTGIVIKNIDPEGKIKYATEIWNAVADDNKFLAGDKVVIGGFSYGMRIIVEESSVEEK
jgi:membrane-bound ClpP family serine protease